MLAVDTTTTSVERVAVPVTRCACLFAAITLLLLAGFLFASSASATLWIIDATTQDGTPGARSVDPGAPTIGLLSWLFVGINGAGDQAIYAQGTGPVYACYGLVYDGSINLDDECSDIPTPVIWGDGVVYSGFVDDSLLTGTLTWTGEMGLEPLIGVTGLFTYSVTDGFYDLDGLAHGAFACWNNPLTPIPGPPDFCGNGTGVTTTAGPNPLDISMVDLTDAIASVVDNMDGTITVQIQDSTYSDCVNDIGCTPDSSSIDITATWRLSATAGTPRPVTGAMSKSLNSCFVVFPALFGEDCTYDASNPWGLAISTWMGPWAQGGYYPIGGSPFAFSPTPVRRPSDGKIPVPVTGALAIDDGGTPCGATEMRGELSVGQAVLNVDNGTPDPHEISWDEITHFFTIGSFVWCQNYPGDGYHGYFFHGGFLDQLKIDPAGDPDSRDFPSELGALPGTGTQYWPMAEAAGIPSFVASSFGFPSVVTSTVNWSCDDNGSVNTPCALAAPPTGWDNVTGTVFVDNTSGEIVRASLFVTSEFDVGGYGTPGVMDSYTANYICLASDDGNNPVVCPDAVHLAPGGSVKIDVMANDAGMTDCTIAGTCAISIISSPVGTANWNTADNTITYTDTNNAGLSTAPNGYKYDTFTYQVVDDSGDTSLASCFAGACIPATSTSTSVTIIYSHADEQPVAVADGDPTPIAVTTNAIAGGTPVEVAILANDTGLGNTPLTVTIESAPGSGQAVVNGSPGSMPGGVTITYTHDIDGEVGTDIMTYRVTDADGDFDTANVTFDITLDETVPLAVDDNVTTVNHINLFNIDVLANDGGLSGAGLTVTADSTSANGGNIWVIGSGTGSTIDYAPPPGGTFVGDDTFQYTVSDSTPDQSTATVTVHVNALPLVFTDILGTLPNNVPTVLTYVDFLQNDSGLLDVPITVVAFYPTALLGSAIVNGSPGDPTGITITYNPSGMTGQDGFTYRVTDNDGQMSENNVSFMVGLPDLFTPEANDDGSVGAPILVDSNSAGTDNVVNVLANDTGLEDGGIIVRLAGTNASHGTAAVQPDNTIQYTPTFDTVGPYPKMETFDYEVEDIDGDVSELAGVVIRIEEVPYPNPDVAATPFGQTVNIDVLSNDDLITLPVTVEVTEQPAMGRAFAESDNTITFFPCNETGEDPFDCLDPPDPDQTFKYHVIKDGRISREVTVDANIGGAVPKGTVDAASMAHVFGPSITIDLFHRGEDLVDPRVVLPSLVTTAGGSLTAPVGPDWGIVTYSPPPPAPDNYDGTDTFIYSLRNDAGTGPTGPSTVVTVSVAQGQVEGLTIYETNSTDETLNRLDWLLSPPPDGIAVVQNSDAASAIGAFGSLAVLLMTDGIKIIAADTGSGQERLLFYEDLPEGASDPQPTATVFWDQSVLPYSNVSGPGNPLAINADSNGNLFVTNPAGGDTELWGFEQTQCSPVVLPTCLEGGFAQPVLLDATIGAEGPVASVALPRDLPSAGGFGGFERDDLIVLLSNPATAVVYDAVDIASRFGGGSAINPDATFVYENGQGPGTATDECLFEFPSTGLPTGITVSPLRDEVLIAMDTGDILIYDEDGERANNGSACNAGIVFTDFATGLGSGTFRMTSSVVGPALNDPQVFVADKDFVAGPDTGRILRFTVDTDGTAIDPDTDGDVVEHARVIPGSEGIASPLGISHLSAVSRSVPESCNVVVMSRQFNPDTLIESIAQQVGNPACADTDPPAPLQGPQGGGMGQLSRSFGNVSAQMQAMAGASSTVLGNENALFCIAVDPREDFFGFGTYDERDLSLNELSTFDSSCEHLAGQGLVIPARFRGFRGMPEAGFPNGRVKLLVTTMIGDVPSYIGMLTHFDLPERGIDLEDPANKPAALNSGFDLTPPVINSALPCGLGIALDERPGLLWGAASGVNPPELPMINSVPGHTVISELTEGKLHTIECNRSRSASRRYSHFISPIRLDVNVAGLPGSTRTVTTSRLEQVHIMIDELDASLAVMAAPPLPFPPTPVWIDNANPVFGPGADTGFRDELQNLLDAGRALVIAGANSDANPGAVVVGVADDNLSTPSVIDPILFSHPPGRTLARASFQVSVANPNLPALVSNLGGVQVLVTSTQPGVDVVGPLRTNNFAPEKIGLSDVPADGAVVSSGTFTVEYDPANTAFDPSLLTATAEFTPTAWFEAVQVFQDMARLADNWPGETVLCDFEQNCEGAIMTQGLAIAFAIWDGLIYSDPLTWQQYTVPPDLASESTGGL